MSYKKTRQNYKNYKNNLYFVGFKYITKIYYSSFFFLTKIFSIKANLVNKKYCIGEIINPTFNLK